MLSSGPPSHLSQKRTNLKAQIAQREVRREEELKRNSMELLRIVQDLHLSGHVRMLRRRETMGVAMHDGSMLWLTVSKGEQSALTTRNRHY
jgi:hypothetical protein